MPAEGSLESRLKARALELGFERAGIARLGPSEHAAFYRAWLAAGYQGEMAYLARPDAVARRLDPRATDPALRSALVVAHNYFPGEDGGADADPARGIVARYARGRDYHKVIKPRLMELLRWLEAEVGHPLPAARASVDTGPVLERELARRAGIGWFGRNAMLIDPRRGSWFFLATLLLELELEPDPPFVEDRCGSCHACLDACPTGALLGRDAAGAPVVDARRCISYLTIELHGPIPRELRPLIGNRIFGCDICQEVCPFNNPRFVQISTEKDFARRDAEPRSLVSLMQMSEAEWDAWTRGSAVRRAGYAGLKRNVAVALGNWGSAEAVPVLAAALSDADALVRAHAAWALGRVGSVEARSALSSRASEEDDLPVLQEISAALGS